MAGAAPTERSKLAAPAASTPITLGPPRARRRRLWYWFRVTREGRIFLLVTTAVAIASVNTGNNLLFLMLGLMLSFLVLSGVMSELVLRRVRVERRLPERAFAGTTGLVEVVLSNDKPYAASYSLEVEDRAEGLPTERRCYFLKVAPRAQQVAAYRRTPKRRGLVRLSGFRLATRFPFGLIEKWLYVDSPSDLLVYPALVPVAEPVLSGALGAADSPAGRPGAGSEVSGLRAYRPGDEARSIHWRRTASLGEVVVRERDRDEAARVTLTVDNARPADADARWDDLFEASVSRTASIAAIALRRGAAVQVVARSSRSGVVAPASAPDPIWRFLALLETVPADDAATHATASETPPDAEHPR